ncbi:signal peptide peptidase SppA [Bacteroides sp. 224]|uniref:signal peptide peptidase SppA n=1 Tax=Bacteroides sp. 224 TaxID=2302936 RepID=UPI0013CFD3A0|nr:signal peptide peptidase SppA [Bacteroides sp. 224]NDV63884.1 signal peptide peptidase SppA [Bacteroides sp. 224]
MKDFFKFTLATITGIVVSSIVLFFIGIMILVGLMSVSESETVINKSSVMMLDLSGELRERSQENPFEEFFGDEDYVSYGLDDILSSIQKAKDHNDIKGIYIQATHLSTSFAALQEIRDALADFKTTGKFIVSYGDVYTQGLYYLSSVSDKVLLNPKGRVEWKGLASTPIFYKDLLEKLGIEMQIFKVGTYKSAVEPYINTEMSEANREQVKEYISSIWSQLVEDVSISRNISADSLNMIADKMVMFSQAEDILNYGLVDSLIYKNDVRDYLKSLANIDKDGKLSVYNLAEMVNVRRNVPKDKSGNIIAVYYAAGGIDMGSSSYSTEETIISSKVIRDLKKLKDQESVKAVVLRVNSGGGSAYGSEQIWHAVEELKAEKPVIVSMGNYAASGGYYISCSADCIVAEPTTLTGSIGIFGMMPNIGGLTKKVGLTFDVVKTNKFSDFGALGRGLNNDEKSLLQMMVNDGYDLFLTRCADGRNMPKEEIAKVAEGRVWTGSKAKELGLVDELGGLDKALQIAIEKADVEGYTVVSYPEKEDFFSLFLKEKGESYIESKLLKSKLGDYYNQLNFIKSIENADLIQARLPFDLNIK